MSDSKVVTMPKSVKVEIIRLTPKQAETLLTHSDVNRNIKTIRIMMYQADMENGRWNPGSALVINDEGKLIDGQHRLTAQIKANLTMSWVVIKGVPQDAQETIDNNAPRSAADALQMLGLSDSGLLAAVAKIIVRLERGTFSGTNNPVTTTEVVDALKEHPEISFSVEAGRRSIGGMTPIRPSVVGAAHWWISQFNDMAEADAFIARVGSLIGEKQGSPVVALAKRSNEIKRMDQRVHWRDYFYMMIKTWNYDVQNQQVNKITTYAKKGGYQILEPLHREISSFSDDDDFTGNDPDGGDDGEDELINPPETDALGELK